jgi:protein tyrosine/serine phosphatase
VIRDLDWPGCHNVRDLGNLPVAGGGSTRWGAVVRSDTLDRLTPAGWSAVAAHGVRTVIDLRTDGEHRVGSGYRPPWLTVLPLPLDDPAEARRHEFYGTALYSRSILDRRPAECAAVLAAIATARPGGVVVHCVAGRDRTGMIALLLLALAGAAPAAIAEDYERSAERLRPLFAKLGEADESIASRRRLSEHGLTAGEVIRSTLDDLDIEKYLHATGLDADRIDALRTRITRPADHR